MAKMRELKKRFKKLLESEDWRATLPEIVAEGKSGLGALFSFLLLDPLMRHRAAVAIGATTASLALMDPEAAKNVCRRFMWHMNEDSGNIGWGIPEAFAETLAASASLAQTYSSILISYIMDLGHADNYCDQDILRRSCYWACGRLAQSSPELAEKSRPWLVRGLRDEDEICRGMAAWALAQLTPDIMEVPPLRELACADNQEECEFFDGDRLVKTTVSQLAELAMNKEHAKAKSIIL